jgi:hypothetical protein
VAISPLPLVLLALLLALVLVVHLPLYYTVDVGIEEGYGGDLPLLRDFNTAEDDEHGTYRWTKDGASIHLPGLGQRPLLARLDFIPISGEVARAGPSHMEVWIEGEEVVTLPVSPGGKQYHLLIPPEWNRGSLALTLHTTTFTLPDDPRSLGTPLDQVRVATAEPSSPLRIPSWGAVWRWLLAVALAWLTTTHALSSGRRPTSETRGWALWFVGGGALLVGVAALLDPPRWAFGAQPALIAAAFCYGTVLVLRPALPPLAARLDIPLNGRVLGWLLLIVAVALGVRLGGRLYPLSMWGDIGFHTNRFIETFGLGDVYLVSRNRGINFPYPPGTYLTLAPLILPWVDIRLVLPFVAALLDALSAPLVYAIVAGGLARTTAHHPRYHQHTALLAAALYVFTAATIMMTWWSFDTHIYTQAAALLLVTALVLFLANGERREASTAPPAAQGIYTLTSARWTVILALLVAGVFLGHFGFLINIVLMGSLLLALVWGVSWWGWWGRGEWARRVRWPLLLAYLGAGLTALAIFYSAYIPMFARQLSEVADGGITGLTERAPIGRDRLWAVLWEAGIIQHFGFFPLLLTPVGVALLACSPRAGASRGCTERRFVLVVLMVCCLLVSLFFAVLPFITLSTQSTRWLMFSAWVVAVGAALAFRLLWRKGRAGRVAVLAMGGFVVWNTITFWIGPMLWRIRPPEPF